MKPLKPKEKIAVVFWRARPRCSQVYAWERGSQPVAVAAFPADFVNRMPPFLLVVGSGTTAQVRFRLTSENFFCSKGSLKSK